MTLITTTTCIPHTYAPIYIWAHQKRVFAAAATAAIGRRALEGCSLIPAYLKGKRGEDGEEVVTR